MKSLPFNLKRCVVAGSTALTLFAAPLVLDTYSADIMDSNVFSSVYAAEDGHDGGQGGGGGHDSGGHDSGHDGGQGGAMGGKGGGQGGKDKGAGSGRRGGKVDIGELLAEDDGDDDSDRPDWAQGNKELNPHRGEGSAGSDIMKGGDYGDIWVILRDDLGNPILDGNDNIQPCLDPACAEYVQLTEDGELPPEFSDDVIPVEFGRLNIARAPDSVLEHSLVEAMAKLDGGELGVDVTLDPSGRLVVDGNTIDSPLENLALYMALLTTDAVGGVITLSVSTTVEGGGDVTYTFTLPEEDRLDVAASAFAAASDKTGDLNTDEVMNISLFMEVDDELAALVGDYQYSTMDTYGGVTVEIMVEVAPGILEPREVLVTDYVNFNIIPAIDGDTDGIDRFTQAADDAVQVLEFVHDNASE